MHLLLSVSVLPSLREITPLSLSRVYAPPNCAPLYRCQSTVALNWAVGGPASAQLPLLGFFTPQCVPLSLNAYSDTLARRWLIPMARIFLKSPGPNPSPFGAPNSAPVL